MSTASVSLDGGQTVGQDQSRAEIIPENGTRTLRRTPFSGKILGVAAFSSTEASALMGATQERYTSTWMALPDS